jgi:uncharacterized protein with HEPN domain
MTRRAPKRLRDVVEATDEILSFTEGKSFDDYLNDRGFGSSSSGSSKSLARL